MKTSAGLMEFYKTYLAWVDVGAPDGKPFRRDCGLCANLYDFSDAWCNLQGAELLNEMHRQFYYKGLNENLPFNEDYGVYVLESNENACHLNIDRINWVKDRVKEEKMNNVGV